MSRERVSAKERLSTPGVRTCPQCHEAKPLEAFGRASGAKDGLDPWCRACKKFKAAERWKRIGAGQNAKARERYRLDPEYRAKLVARNRQRYAHTTTTQKHQARVRHLRRRFGLTESDYEALLAEQGGVCAVCQMPETVRDHRTGALQSLAVDHDHATGLVRGLLCRKCNVALGLLSDDADLVGKLLTYVLKDRSR